MRLPGFKPTTIRFHYAGKVIRMYVLEGREILLRILPFLNPPTEIFQELVVEKFDLSTRFQSTNESGNCIDDKTITVFVLSKRQLFLFLRNLYAVKVRDLLDDFYI